MHNKFNEAFNDEKMPEFSKAKVKKKLMKAFDEEPQEAKNRDKKMRFAVGRRMATVFSIFLIILISGGTVLAAVPAVKEGLINGVKKIFVSKKEAVNEVYGDKDCEKYMQIVENATETSTFNEDEIAFELISYMGDENGSQILLQYAVNEDYPSNYPAYSEMKAWGVTDVGFGGEKWINKENNQGYLVLYLTPMAVGEYTLQLNDIWWGSRYLVGTYEVTFDVRKENISTMYNIDKEYYLQFDGSNPKNVDINSVGLSPIACTITMKVHEDFSVNEAFDTLFTPRDDEAYFYDVNGEKLDIKLIGSYCSDWETNGKFDSLGCSLAKEGAEVTMLIMFDQTADFSSINGIHFDGVDIDFGK